MTRYRVVDVFTDTPLSGNALCVVLDPVDDDAVKQAIAREVNLSETTFVTVTGDGTYDVRIFTASAELPFAGHPRSARRGCSGRAGGRSDHPGPPSTSRCRRRAP